MGGKDDETVDQLLEKLAKKGKKVKLLDESLDGELLMNQENGKHIGSIEEQDIEEDI